MKKAVIILVVILITGLAVKAQILIGGSLGIDHNREEKDGYRYSSTSNFVFSILPKVGFYLNDKFALGVETGIIRSVTKYSTSDDKTVETSWKIASFARYHIVKVNNFVFLLEGNLGFFRSKAVIPGEWMFQAEEVPKNIFGITVQPVLAYHITKKVSIEASCDFLKFGLIRSSYKLGETKYTNNYFGLGLNSNIDNSISNTLKVGMIFKF